MMQLVIGFGGIDLYMILQLENGSLRLNYRYLQYKAVRLFVESAVCSGVMKYLNIDFNLLVTLIIKQLLNLVIIRITTTDLFLFIFCPIFRQFHHRLAQPSGQRDTTEFNTLNVLSLILYRVVDR